MIGNGIRLIVLAACALLLTSCSKPPAGTFETPEQAVQALAAVIGTHDTARVEELFGPGSMKMFQSGDENQDQVAGERVKALIAEAVAFDDYDENTRLALFGNKEWPFPIPLVRENGRWRFDTAKGREELLNRRVGHNELKTLATLHEIVDAQREYFSGGHDGNPPAFAQKFLSSEGKHDGLYWSPVEGEPQSPLGDLLANSEVTAEAGQPYNGYNYRMLTGQGSNAPGGALEYRNAEGLMADGFAVIAWPAEHGSSGVMTFQINQRGIVYQKDLGDETESLAKTVTVFDPDASWAPTGDTDADDDDEDDEDDDAGPAAAAEPQPAPPAETPVPVDEKGTE